MPFKVIGLYSLFWRVAYPPHQIKYMDYKEILHKMTYNRRPLNAEVFAYN